MTFGRNQKFRLVTCYSRTKGIFRSSYVNPAALASTCLSFCRASCAILITTAFRQRNRCLHKNKDTSIALKRNDRLLCLCQQGRMRSRLTVVSTLCREYGRPPAPCSAFLSLVSRIDQWYQNPGRLLSELHLILGCPTCSHLNFPLVCDSCETGISILILIK